MAPEADTAATPETAAGASKTADHAGSRGGPRVTIDTWKRLAASVLCGCFMWLGVPDYDLWWLGFVAWLPWLWAIDGQTPRRAFGYGMVAGVSAISVGYFWMTELLMRFAGIPIAPASAIHVLFSTVTGAQWALAALIVAWVQQRTGRRTLWIAPVAWAFVELTLPNIFPTFMALMWCWQPLLIQHAELGGVATVSFSMLAINAALYELWVARAREGRFHKKAAMLAAAWIVGIPAYGAVRMHQVDQMIEAAPKVRYGVVQGNFGIETYTLSKMKRQILADMQAETRRLQQQEGAEVAVWGETAYPYASFRRDRKQDHSRNRPYRVRRGFDIPLIFGAVTGAPPKQNPYPWNTAFVLDGEQLSGRYDKNYPLIFGEYIPVVDPEWFIELIPTASHLNRGDGPAALEVAGHPVGPMICYEDILPTFARDIANAGVSVFVNLTNDSWFGRTREQGEHLGLAVFRTVEHRRGMVRAVNAGASAYVDPAGRVLHRTRVTDSDVEGYPGAEGFAVDVPMIEPSYRSVYGTTGHLFGFILLVGIGFMSRRRGPSPA
jgi:apolipoprotein N-acyltransferase